MFGSLQDEEAETLVKLLMKVAESLNAVNVPFNSETSHQTQKVET